MKLRESKGLAVCAMVLMVILIIVAVCTHVVSDIWEYSVLFLGFMTVFSHLMALSLVKMSKVAASKLDNVALVLAILTIIDLIVVFILNFCEFY